MEYEDEELVARTKKGDRKAFNELVGKYKDKMFSLTYRLTGDRESALDLVQDTFYNAYTNISRFRSESSFSSWLYRIASNKTLNFLKRKKLVAFVSFSGKSTDEPSYVMPDNVQNAELAGEITKAIGELPNKQKLTFNLRYFEKLPFAEIAKIMGKSESTVKTNYQKAVEKLQKKLEHFR